MPGAIVSRSTDARRRRGLKRLPAQQLQPGPAPADRRWMVFGVCAFCWWRWPWSSARRCGTSSSTTTTTKTSTATPTSPTASPRRRSFGPLPQLATAQWAPLTWLSHMLDWQLYGRWAGGHHLTSVLLHAATVLLLFLVLRRMTGPALASALVAAVFAIHPLHVESVAWIAERKGVLSGLFFVLTLAAYVGYVRRPFSWPRYLGVVVLFALGLMAKPMLVTLPFVLLLLDYWPLGRFGLGIGRFFGQRRFGPTGVGSETWPCPLPRPAPHPRPLSAPCAWSAGEGSVGAHRPPGTRNAIATRPVGDAHPTVCLSRRSRCLCWRPVPASWRW